MPGFTSIVRTGPASTVSKRQQTITQAFKTLVNTCKDNDCGAAYSACLTWARQAYGYTTPTPTQLAAISPPMAQELASMEKTLYASEESSPWNGKLLLSAVAHANRPTALGTGDTAATLYYRRCTPAPSGP